MSFNLFPVRIYEPRHITRRNRYILKFLEYFFCKNTHIFKYMLKNTSELHMLL